MKKLCLLLLIACLFILTACKNENSASTVNKNKVPVDLKTLPSLRDIYKDDFLIGTIYAPEGLGQKDVELMDTQFNVVTPENTLKPENVQMDEGTFTYDSQDQMLAFAKEHNLLMVGHTLVWHQQIPDWMQEVTDREMAIKQLKNHITNVVGHYKGQILSWDVVNEAIEDNMALPEDGDWTKCLRSTKWLESIGPDYLALAFKFAKEADPDCKLYYNDYNLSIKNKADVAYAMIKDMLEDGVPIDGVGMQGHYQTGMPTDGLEYGIKKLSSLGIEISVTELDVTCQKTINGELSAQGEDEQALTYANIFHTLKKYRDKIARVTFWGSVDTKSWRGEQCPCLFDGKYIPKEAFYAVADPEGYIKKHTGKGSTEDGSKGTAAYGTPTIDGVKEELWNTTKTMEVNRQVLAWEGATGKVKALWDENHLYILFDVKDAVLDTSGTKEEMKDSIEIFLDQKNDKKYRYGEDDGQYRVNCEGKLTFGSIPSKEGVQAAVTKESGGYMVEMVIPFTKEMKADTTVGFDAQINDAKLGRREGIVRFSDTTDQIDRSTEYFGTLTLMK